MIVTDDDGTQTEVTEPRAVKMLRYLLRTQGRLASIARGRLEVDFAEPQRRLKVAWVETDSAT